ncbi:MAG TPA: hypothetical protein VFI23_16325 [Rhizomicrobium sp.]|nr:hypothetical protein [Rhizomicrobium sp.]
MQIEQYLKRAKEAEAWAITAGNELQKQCWLEIANGYRNLAQARLMSAPPSPPSQAAAQE